MDISELENKIFLFIAKRLGVNTQDLSGSTSFTSDLDLGSFRALELISEIEDEFDVNIPAADMMNIYTVDDLINYVIKHKDGG